ncbi:MAG: hypothetical protein ABSA33_04545 [Candidatus Micrarchaeaceae archaeon]
MESPLVWIIAAIGSAALLGVFWRMKPGFGPYNLRVVAIVLVATFASLLALRAGTSETAAMGILGAIAGYVFGIKDSKDS